MIDIQKLNNSQLREGYIRKNFPEDHKHILTYPGQSFAEKLYLWNGGEKGYCPVCGRPTKFISIHKGYNKFCGKSCANIGTDTKRKQTNLRKYGTDNYGKLIRGTTAGPQDSSTILKMRNARWGSCEELSNIGYNEDGDWICKCPHPGCNQCKEKVYTIKSQMYWTRKVHNTEPCTKLLPVQSHFSTLEVKIRQWLDGWEVEYATNDRRFGQEMDIYIPELKLAIEVNGSYWHSTQHKTPLYHINKSLLLADHGIRCVFVWDDYKDEDIKEFLFAIIKGLDLGPWIKKWFPDIKGWPVDFGLTTGHWQEHRCMHGGFECYDAGVI
nr:MAG TPA: endonuclease-like protein [Caudoviricetes sp.]